MPELVCTSATCGLAYRVEDGIPVLLVDEARRPQPAPDPPGGPARAGTDQPEATAGPAPGTGQD
jgi:hypothetical protein